ncbi:MAG: hypothetical protein OER88_08890 [Planctomycetota bacterium]|nr:hypothetical protein [Planctomycetota bacterium]
MRVCLLATALIAGSGAAAAEDEAPKLTWQFDGHASLPEAAHAAKRAGKRLLVGLSGSPG